MNIPSALAARVTRLAIDNIGREYPNAPGHVLRTARDLRPTRELHPAFFGSFDWHSCVHQHWLLVRLLRMDLAGSEADAARTAVTDSLTAPNLAAEAAYLREHPAFERTYGWAWLLKLATEVAAWADPAASDISNALAAPVATAREAWMAYLPRATYPIRAGTHANTAFGIMFALEHARGTGDDAFTAALTDRATAWFAEDRDYPAHLEPGGDEFLSGALIEAALMYRVLEPAAFATWYAAFLPRPPASVLEPAAVGDRSDPKIVHLDGLNLSRAWCWRMLAGGSRSDAALATAAARRHLDAALPHLFSGEYVGEHWVSTFALLALTG